MRIAVCISGACSTPTGNIIKNHLRLQERFPTADFYYGTWTSYKSEFEKIFPDKRCHYYDEPVVYHPYLEIDRSAIISTHYNDTIDWVKRGNNDRREWTKHHTKQILINAWLSTELLERYDIIIRTRFDAFISPEANFDSYIDDTLQNHRANCFGTRTPKKINEINEIASIGNWTVRLMDHLIIYPADCMDTNNVNELHKSKRLHAAEYGWYQVISMPHGSQHRNHDGWVNHDKKVLTGDLQR